MGGGCGAGAGPDPPWFLPVCLAWGGGTEPGGWDAALVGVGIQYHTAIRIKQVSQLPTPTKTGPLWVQIL